MVQTVAGAVMTAPGRDNDGAGKEFSAGGVVVKDGKVLLVQVRNLKNERVWTFPKGHVEKGETAKQAACREVEEETGYRCRATRTIFTARYMFKREGRLIHKRVQWYWMEAGAKLGTPDAAEVIATKWVTFRKAADLVSYPSDKDLLERAQKKAETKTEPAKR